MKTITTIALIFALSYASFAQQSTEQRRQRMNPEQREQMQVSSAQRQTEQMKALLNLDEEQESAIHKINLKYTILRTQVSEATRTEEGTNVRGFLSELEEKRESEILPILNENQIEIFFTQKKEQQERREQMRERVDQRRQQRTRDTE
jgi:ABC-type lipoprotein release transport system permease subunit